MNPALLRMQHEPSGRGRMAGLTLAELLVTLAVAAILATVGGPALGGLLLDARLAAATHQLAQAIHHARSEAVRRGETVVLCGNGAGNSCGSWEDGWQLRLPAGGNGPPSVLLTSAPVAGIRITANRGSFALQPFGRRATNGTLLLCDRRGHGRAVIVSVAGRARVAPPTTALPCAA